MPSSHKSESVPSQAVPLKGSSEPSADAGSQSLSMPSQTSRSLSVVSEQTSAPPEHEFVPSSHKSESGPSQAVPLKGSSEPSGDAGSQSLSAPSQMSGMSPVSSSHDCVPPTQVEMPSSQRSPSAPSHGSSYHGSSMPSVVTGLQSSSIVLHISLLSSDSSLQTWTATKH